MLPIVVVDDVHDDLLLVERALKHCKIQNPIHFLSSGDECIAYFNGTRTETRTDLSKGALVFLDLIMSPTGGLQVLRALNGNPEFKKSFVVLLSGVSNFKAIQEGYQLGARTFLIKPLVPDDVLQLLNGFPTRLVAKEHPSGNVIDLLTSPESEKESVTLSSDTSRIVTVSA